MSVIIVQIGQCGNQLGLNFFSDLIQESKYVAESITFNIINSFFHRKNQSSKLYANAVMVDMESKVIEKCVIDAEKRGFCYDTNLVVKKQGGSGNNWANGFFNHGPSVEEDFVEKFSKLMDFLFIVDSVIVVNSLAGGTGSGLGSYINILIKDNFPSINLVNLNIWPSSTGEVIVNSYNTLLSLSESYKVSDLIFIIDNQQLFDTCKTVYKLKKMNYAHLNSLISRQLLSAIVPVVDESNLTKSRVSVWSVKSQVSLITETLGIDSRFKFGKIISIPEIPDDQVAFTNNSWNALVKECNYKLDTYKRLMLIFRGKELETVSSDDLFNKEICIQKSHQEFKKLSKHLTLVINSNFMVAPLENSISKATQMFDLKVFTHHYYKFGLEPSDFLNSFAICSQIIYDYTYY